MNERRIILSISVPKIPTDFEWLRQIGERRAQWIPSDWPVDLELTADRKGVTGHLGENTPIDQIEALREQTEEIDCPLRSLYLPFDPTSDPGTIGNELSAVNGWTDLAGYTGISLIRLRLISPCDRSLLDPESPLRLTINYMRDNNMRIALSTPGTIESALEELINLYPQEENVGFDLEAPSLDDIGSVEKLLTNPSIQSLHFNLSESPNVSDSKEKLQTVIQRLDDNSPAIVLCLG